jgi:hypothetical protein
MDRPHVSENDLAPDADGFVVYRIPDVFLALKVAVQPALGQLGGLENVADGGVEITLDGKQLQGSLDDFSTGSGTFIRHGKSTQ